MPSTPLPPRSTGPISTPSEITLADPCRVANVIMVVHARINTRNNNTTSSQGFSAMIFNGFMSLPSLDLAARLSSATTTPPSPYLAQFTFRFKPYRSRA
jgi:hypothetical protein